MKEQIKQIKEDIIKRINDLLDEEVFTDETLRLTDAISIYYGNDRSFCQIYALESNSRIAIAEDEIDCGKRLRLEDVPIEPLSELLEALQLESYEVED